MQWAHAQKSERPPFGDLKSDSITLRRLGVSRRDWDLNLSAAQRQKLAMVDKFGLQPSQWSPQPGAVVTAGITRPCQGRSHRTAVRFSHAKDSRGRSLAADIVILQELEAHLRRFSDTVFCSAIRVTPMAQ